MSQIHSLFYWLYNFGIGVKRLSIDKKTPYSSTDLLIAALYCVVTVSRSFSVRSGPLWRLSVKQCNKHAQNGKIGRKYFHDCLVTLKPL